MAHKDMKLLGSIVAFEGNSDTISTQLRLLPKSPQVLILPGVQCHLPNTSLEQGFDARAFVKQVHDALVARNETAKTFLLGSTPTNKRLVFMNGGTPSAQALCIKAIMKHETGEDEVKAGTIFDELVKDGAAGLLERRRRKKGLYGGSSHRLGEEDDGQDPITRAMRAADALDRQTANLQLSDDPDLLVPTRQRSSSLPLYGYSDALGDAAPFFVFGARPADIDGQADDGAAPSRRGSHIFPQFDEAAQRPVLLDPWNPSMDPYSPSCIGESYEPPSLRDRIEIEACSPTSTRFSTQTLDNVVYGEASVLDVRHSMARGSLARVKSLDRLYPSSPMFRDLGIPSHSWLAEPEVPCRHRHQSLMVVRDANDKPWNRMSLDERPHSLMSRPPPPTIRVAPVPITKKKRGKRHVRARSTYVDRGTDPESDCDEEGPFEPVFVCTEDLVLFLKDDTADRVLESAIDAFREGRYPVIPPPPREAERANHVDKSIPGTPSSRASETSRRSITALDEKLPDEKSPISIEPTDMDDYDPFAYMQASVQAPKTPQPTVTVIRPPTPAHTPPPSVGTPEGGLKLHEFRVASSQTAVAVQNSLRSILAEYFPADTQGYHQFQFPLLPELDGLWKPIFRANETDSPQKGEGNLHQILAIGSQSGVKREYSISITSQLEKLGSKSTELGRADSVDFRYLLANAMQAFTAQPLANQTSDNPFTNSYLLATLIVPHLETYLALHSEVRYLLLQYPPEHLGTVLALQKLVGVDLMKVAQIVDSSSKENLPFTHIRGASIGSKSESNQAKRSSPPPGSSSDVPVSKANYLLTSTASDKDIAKFVSTVWNIPADIWDSEMSEASIRSASTRRSRPSPLKLGRDNLSPFPKADLYSPVSPKTIVASHPAPEAPQATPRPPSATGSFLTSKSFKSKHGRCKSRGNNTLHGDSASIMTYDPAEDSDYDLEERRLMPHFLRKAGTRKPNSRKALKFLGLA
ncbi:hypothetical protein HIM_00005 [Hirsutella minnesotensis 3608]|nr:hypothetical protein HIM_00005 [Hirsutella minnesotensis 3608]